MGVEDYYKILGINKSASILEIKRAYKKLAFKYHPDRNIGDKKAEAMMNLLNEAIGVFEDPIRKKDYDDLLVKQNFKNKQESVFEEGLEHAAKGEFLEAIKCFSEAVKINKCDHKAFFNRAQVYFNLGEYAEAAKDFEIVLFLNPTHNKSRMMLGVTLRRQGRLAEALIKFNESIEYSKDDPNLFYNRGNVFFEMNNLEDAIIDFYEALKLKPNFKSAKEQFDSANRLVKLKKPVLRKRFGYKKQTANSYLEILILIMVFLFVLLIWF